MLFLRKLMRRGVTWLAAVGVMTAVAGVGTPVAGAFAAAPPAGAQAAATTFRDLVGVTCTAATKCWAVGNTRQGATVNQVVRWTGQKWVQVAVPNPAGTSGNADNELHGVECVSAIDCWAVGLYSTSATTEVGEALHWNGKKWGLVPAPAGQHRSDSTDLFGVTCTDTSNCWAVGVTGGATNALNDVLHWNGKSWGKVAAPNPAGTGSADSNELTSVQCVTAMDCWATGWVLGTRTAGARLNQMLHWNGKTWRQVSVPQPGGTGPDSFNNSASLACSSSVKCFAVGEYEASSGARPLLNQVLSWNGKTWRKVSVPEPGGAGSNDFDELAGINCESAIDCWAVGDASGANPESDLNLALHWDGTKWSAVTTPDPAGQGFDDRNVLLSVDCPATRNCFAVGTQQVGSGNRLNEFLHFTGTKWLVRG